MCGKGLLVWQNITELLIQFFPDLLVHLEEICLGVDFSVGLGSEVFSLQKEKS